MCSGNMGVSNNIGILHVCCRRRLPVLMVKLRMAQSLADAIKFIEQGRILLVEYPSLHTHTCTHTHTHFMQALGKLVGTH